MDRNYRRNMMAGLQDSLYTNNSMGCYKGIVEDVEDPLGLGRVKVRMYSLNGDYKDLDTEGLMWIEPIHRTKGSFDPPELWDRVTISFENGDRDRPVITGYWYSIPAGRGRLPHNIRRGSEVPPDCWAHNNLYPQTLGIARSSEGSAVWLEDITHGGLYDSTMHYQDSGGKYIKINSRRRNSPDYTPQGNVGGNPGLDDWQPGVVYRLGDISGSRAEIYTTGEFGMGLGSWTHTVNDFNGATVSTEYIQNMGGMSGEMSVMGQSNHTFVCSSGYALVSEVADSVATLSSKGVGDPSQNLFVQQLWDGPGA